MKELMRKKRGITLIALVVTIIVLLILAGVSIQMITGQSGILSQARQAKEETEKAQIKDDVQREILEEMMSKGGEDLTAEELYKILDNYFKDVKEPGEGEDNPWNAKDFPANFPELESKEGGYLFQLGDIYSGTLSGGNTLIEKGTATDIENNLKEYQGTADNKKYVDLKVDICGESGTEDDWEVFYAEGGRIYLIAADYVPVEKINQGDMQVIGGTALGISAHNLQQCRNLQHVVYWGSYTPEKVIQWMPDLPTKNFKEDAYIKQIKHDGYDLLSNKDTNDNACAVSQLISKEVWNPITNKINTTIGKDVIEFTIGGPTLQMWCAAWNKVVDETDENEFKKMEAISDDSWTGYKVRVGETEDTFLFMNGTKNELDYNQLSTLQTQYPTFFPHMNKVEDCACYCLASPSAQNSGQLVGVYAGGFVVGILYNNSENGVRPVVCLKPNVKLVEKENTEDKIVYDLV